MSSIFTKIINREIPGQFIYEDDICVALLDKFPAVPGQTLVIPKLEVDYFCDLDEDIFLHIFSVAKKVAEALDTTFDTERTCMVVEGFEVPHMHIKLYPLEDTKTPLGKIMPEGKEASDETLDEQAKEIKENLID